MLRTARSWRMPWRRHTLSSQRSSLGGFMARRASAIAVLDRGSNIDKAHGVVAANRPELTSKLWKQIEDVTDMLNDTPISEIEALRAGDEAKIEKITVLLQSVKRIMS